MEFNSLIQVLIASKKFERETIQILQDLNSSYSTISPFLFLSLSLCYSIFSLGFRLILPATSILSFLPSLSLFGKVFLSHSSALHEIIENESCCCFQLGCYRYR